MTVTLITGASSGLGAELARQLAAKGVDLALCARRLERLESLREEILAAHPQRRVEVRTLDVNDEPQVFEVFQAFAADFGGIDRVVVNAGIGKGARIGAGRPQANRETASTNVLGALAQTEAAMEIFRAQGRGHLVLISSVAALRGMPKAMTVYAASKAFVAHLGEGLRSELLGSPDLDIAVTTILPGYTASEFHDPSAKPPPFMVDTAAGVAGIVKAIEAKAATARVPAWPWAPVGTALAHLPLRVVRKLT